jgi:hypothetical protein
MAEGESRRDVKLNLAVLKPSRRRVRAGDLFVMLPTDGSYLFGRVVRTDAVVLAPGAILIYIYRHRSRNKSVPPADFLRPQDLLVPPLLTNRLPWSRGYFETIANLPLVAEDVLSQHCFKRVSFGYYVDEWGRRLPGPSEPTGTYGLHSYRTIDDAVSEALGIPQVSD